MLLNNNKNLPHKELENEAINQLLIILNETSHDFDINWDYSFAFSGFKISLLKINMKSHLYILIKKVMEVLTLLQLKKDLLKQLKQTQLVILELE